MVYNVTKTTAMEILQTNSMVSLLVCTAYLLQSIDLDFSERGFTSVSFDLDNVNQELINASLGTGID